MSTKLSMAQLRAENAKLRASLAEAQREPAAPEAPKAEVVTRVYPSLERLRAMEFGVPADATMAVLTKNGKLHYYRVYANGSRGQYWLDDAQTKPFFHAPSAKECAILRAEFASTAPTE